MSPARMLRELLSRPGLVLLPCCFDALSARLIEQAGFSAAFMSGFAVSAARLGGPDTGLISYGEMVDQARQITEAVRLPIIGDGDTGYGNAMNVKRTVAGYARAGLAAVMIEDQVAPKRCGHTQGKQVVDREQALVRLRAALDARDEGADILVMARTDARQTHGFDEALARGRAFAELGADMVFLEAPESVDEMRVLCREIAAPCMANLLDHGRSPIVTPAELEAIGYKLAAYPLTLLTVAIDAMRSSLAILAQHRHPGVPLDFRTVQKIVGFDQYDIQQSRYSVTGRGQSDNT